jgi:hypothetical protein
MTKSACVGASVPLARLADEGKRAAQVVSHHVIEGGQEVGALGGERPIGPAIDQFSRILTEVVQLAPIGIVFVPRDAPTPRGERAKCKDTAQDVVFREDVLSRPFAEGSALYSRGDWETACT